MTAWRTTNLTVGRGHSMAATSTFDEEEAPRKEEDIKTSESTEKTTLDETEKTLKWLFHSMHGIRERERER
jgi:hypothetical protein